MIHAGIPQAALLALWGLVLLFSALSGRLDLLLHAAFHGLVAAAGVLLLLLAALLLILDRPATRRPLPWPWLASALVAGAVLLLPPDPSFSTLLASRPPGLPEVPPPSFLLPPEQRSLSEWVRLLRSRPDPALHDGQPVRISGFVLPQPQGAPLIARVMVRCCLADATPVGLPVVWPAGYSPRANQWLALEGRMATRLVQGEPTAVIEARRLRSIPRPRRPLEP